MKKLLLASCLFAHFGAAAQMMVNTFNTPLLTLSSAMVFKSNTTTLPSVSGGVLTLTSDASGYESKAATFTQKINPTGNWWMQFTYTPSGALWGDGMALVIHNDARGTAAVGGCGAPLGCGFTNCSYGYAISPSVDFEINLYTGGGSTMGVGLNTNGAVGTYTSTGTVSVNSGNPITVLLKYNSATNVLSALLTDKTTGNTWSATYSVNFATAVGASAYVAFTGGTGAATVTQKISDFYYRGAKG